MTTRRLVSLAVVAVLALCLFARAEQRVLYETKSPYNTIVVTEDARGLRTLWFERYGVRQSVVKVGDPDHLELPRQHLLNDVFAGTGKHSHYRVTMGANALHLVGIGDSLLKGVEQGVTDVNSLDT